MESFDLANHPLEYIRSLIGSVLHPSYFLEVAQYMYLPRTRNTKDRIITKIRARDLNGDWLTRRLTTLQPDYEVCLQSRVYNTQGSLVGHLPFVDCLGSLMPEVFRFSVDKRYGLADTFQLYKTSRSYHAYFAGLLSENLWKDFMAQFLLWNEPKTDFYLIDARWIGHSLLNGYAGLRWSANSRRHATFPEYHSTQQLHTAD